jgi:hypothetical protein
MVHAASLCWVLLKEEHESFADKSVRVCDKNCQLIR